MFDHDYGPFATPADAHAEWHLNAGVPMGTPGCPQDACHAPDFYWPEETSTGIRCGNKDAHLSKRAYHETVGDVASCFAVSAEYAAFAQAGLASAQAMAEPKTEGPCACGPWGLCSPHSLEYQNTWGRAYNE